MSNNLIETLSEIQQIGEEAKEFNLTAATKNLMRPDFEKSVVVVSLSELNENAFVEWATKSTSDLTFYQSAIKPLSSDLEIESKGIKLSVYLNCGEMLDFEQVEFIKNTLWFRPSGSYSIILGGAENIEDEADLETIEKGMWRILLPDPKEDWNKQSLSEHNIYLWSESEPKQFLTSRLDNDRKHIVSWLENEQDNNVAKYLAHKILSQIELKKEQREEPEVVDYNFEIQKIRNAQESIVSLRRRALNGISSDSAFIEKYLLHSLQELEMKMLKDVKSYINKRFHGLRIHSLKENDYVSILQVYITQNINQWGQQIQKDFNNQSNEMISDIKSLLDNADWQFINQSIKSVNSSEEYPKAIFGDLVDFKESFNTLEALFPSETTPENFNSEPSSLQSFPFDFAISTTFLVVVGGIFGLVPGIITGAGSLFLLKKSKNQKIQEVEENAQQIIINVTKTISINIREQIPLTLNALREPISEKLRTLELLLERCTIKIQEQSKKINQVNHIDEKINKLRSQLQNK